MSIGKSIIGALVIILVLAACGQKSPEQLFIDQEHDEIMKIHDDVMPRLSDIHKLRKRLKKDEALKESPLVDVLESADDAMMEWMHAYDKPSPSDPNYEGYLADQKIKITQVSKMMLSAISQAENKLGS